MEHSPEKQSNSMSDLNKSTGRLAAGTSSSTDTHISSVNYSDATTSFVYGCDQSVKIKEETINDQERHQGGDHNHLSEKSELDEKPLSSDKKSAVKTEIVYEYDETLEIKEEIIQDQETILRQKIEKKYESTLNTIGTREADILAANTLRTHQKKKIQESDTEPGKKYKCPRCARSYKQKSGLNAHERFECDVTPQFICEFCDKSFKRKCTRDVHVGMVHQRTNSNQNKAKTQESKQEPGKKYKCRKCARTYGHKFNLNTHQKFECGLTAQFLCKFCNKRYKQRSSMNRHIALMHQKINPNQNKQNTKSHISQATYSCDKCFRSYDSLTGLKIHNRFKHAADKPEFTCDFCGYKTYLKSSLSKHIFSRHFKNSETSEAKHSCAKCLR